MAKSVQLVNNVSALKEAYPYLWRELAGLGRLEALAGRDPLLVIEARTGVPTLALERPEGQVFIHSGYDPEKEAERFVGQFAPAEVVRYKHVLFYGVGLGYHVEAFLKRFPGLSFTLYEPRPAVFYHYLCYRSLKDLSLKSLRRIFVEQDPGDVGRFASEFLAAVQDEVLFVVLPCYEHLFADDYARFATHFRQSIRDVRTSLHTNLGFQKRWIVNSLINFSEVIKTPNILHDIDAAKFFKDKPALLVAAGPSLDEEIENIRQIKDSGLAYIFSVGSAINALVEHGIYPDAACSYDPTEVNQRVFARVNQMGITSIPLIFGSSIGFETLQQYRGPKLHMITSQDTVARYFLRRSGNQPVKTVADAPSIAVLTLNILLELGFNPVVLVGQNLAYKQDRFYAQGITYAQQAGELGEDDKENLVEVEDVSGKMVYSTDGFVKARRQMEQYIAAYSSRGLEVINCTRGGARIEGAGFRELEEVIKRRLLKARVVAGDWLPDSQANAYDMDYVVRQAATMEVELKELVKSIEEVYQHLRRLSNLAQYNDSRQIEKAFQKLDKVFKKMQKNDFYTVFLQPMNRVQHELLGKNVASVRFDRDPARKARVVVQEFGKFVQACEQDIQLVQPVYQQAKDRITAYAGRNDEEATMS